MKTKPSSPIPLLPIKYVSITDEGVTKNHKGWQITKGRKTLLPEMTFPNLVCQAQETIHLEKLLYKNCCKDKC